MTIIAVEKYNEAYIRIVCEPSEAYELRDFFTFDVPGAKFMPSYKSKAWDGKIRLFNPLTGLLYAGLRTYIEKFCQERKYDIHYLTDFAPKEFSLKEAEDFIAKLKQYGWLNMEPRDYQLDGFVHAIRERRAFLLSPTASGKSLIMYLIVSYHDAKKCLIIVPTTGLVLQMKNDFIEYGLDEEFIHCIYSGQEKYSNQRVTISTWQSIYKMPKSWFAKYGVVLVDEAHAAKAASITSIMKKLESCAHRIGVSGTLDGMKTNKFVLEGLFGPVRTVTTMKELMEAGHISNLKIKCIVLNYPSEIRRAIKHLKSYPEEVTHLLTLPSRNRFIRNLALSLKDNTLVLFKFGDHGRTLYDQIKKETNRPVYFVFGDVEVEERERIRQIVETEENTIIVASMGTFKMGINIKRLHNIIFTHPSKDQITILQSIGRTLRLHESKDYAVLYDISDDLSIKTWKNFTFLHFIERVKIYIKEQFTYQIYQVDLKVKNEWKI